MGSKCELCKHTVFREIKVIIKTCTICMFCLEFFSEDRSLMSTRAMTIGEIWFIQRNMDWLKLKTFTFQWESITQRCETFNIVSKVLIPVWKFKWWQNWRLVHKGQKCWWCHWWRILSQGRLSFWKCVEKCCKIGAKRYSNSFTSWKCKGEIKI